MLLLNFLVLQAAQVDIKSQYNFFNISYEELPIEQGKKKKKGIKKRKLKHYSHPRKTNRLTWYPYIISVFLVLLALTTLGTIFIYIGGQMMAWTTLLILGFVFLCLSMVLSILLAFADSRQWFGAWVHAAFNHFCLLGVGIFLGIMGFLWANPILWIMGISLFVLSVVFLILNLGGIIGN